jgi:SAM-dependent methyltransferase
MQQPPSLFDRSALQAHRARSSGRDAEAWFLHEQAVALVSERLEEVNRTFTNIAVVGWKPEIWDALGKDVRHVADDEVLDLSEESCDLIVHALGLHWANDPVGQLVQMRRALKPDGLMIAVFFGGQTLHQLRIALAEAESTIAGGLSPRVAPMGDIRDLGALLQRAGYALPVADHFEFNVSYETPLHLMHDLRAMGETNALTGRRRTVLRRDVLAAALAAYQQHFSDEEGRATATFDMMFLTGWTPSVDQQKPLRPGSAQARLADALGTVERDPEDKDA